MECRRHVKLRCMSAAVRHLLGRLVRQRLFLLLFVTYAYFYQGSDPNQASRYLLAHAIATRGAPDITPEHAKTTNKAQLGGRFYSEKAPGVSLLAVPVVWLFERVDSAL